MQQKLKILTGVILLFILFKNIHGMEDANRTLSPQTSKNSCTLPPHPKFGQWTIFQANLTSSSGDVVPMGTVLEVSCYDNYKLEGGGIVLCVRGEWKPTLGNCLSTCPSLHTSTTTTVNCTYKGETLATCSDVVEGTRAEFRCAPFYEIQGMNKFPVRICSNGQWSGGLPECVPVCGKKGITKDYTLIVGGFNTTSLEYPWQAALYVKSNKVLICGGTLLSQRTILTAAHCVTNDKGQLEPKENYVVAVGKSYRSYDDSRDPAAQFSSIEEIYVPRQYRGYIQRYFGDIAIIVANTTFVLSLNVQPVCVVWEKTFHQSLENVTRVKQSYVSGWGFTSEDENPSDVLKSLKVPVINKTECEHRLSEEDLEYLTYDKLCAGFLDSGMSVCKGDSGGGLVTKQGDRYYITAVVSIAPQVSSRPTGGCDSQKYGFYTRFSYYIEDFIIDLEAKFGGNYRSQQNVSCTDGHCLPISISTTSTRSCILPDHPTFGNWSIFGPSPNHFIPGMLVSSGTVLKIQCNPNYILRGNITLFCNNGFWSSSVGQCLDGSLPRCFLTGTYGCCPNNVTAATGPNNEGCGCEISEYGCCPDGTSEARGRYYEGCTAVQRNLPAICSKPKERGLCLKEEWVWYYNPDTDGCAPMTFNGCNEHNGITTREECERTCSTETHKAYLALLKSRNIDIEGPLKSLDRLLFTHKYSNLIH
ncbi:mannan-binding lectin serine protease 1-like [Zophobas morio]|uniref:mannan-binding lectin serine protease 1-like n=1 Tax=Zophobas morio TaxID=2755281 RepID=UPI003082B31C